MTDFTTGWKKLRIMDAAPADNSCDFWIHPDTPIVIRRCHHGYYFTYHDREGSPWVCWFFDDMASAAKEVQRVMDGPAGKHNR